MVTQRMLQLARLALDVVMLPDDGSALSRRTKAVARTVLGLTPTSKPKPAPKPAAAPAPTAAMMRQAIHELNQAEAEAKARAEASKAADVELREGVAESLQHIVNMGSGFDPNGRRVAAAKDALHNMSGDGIGPDERAALDTMLTFEERDARARQSQLDAIRGKRGGR